MRPKRRRHFAFVLLRWLTWFYPRVGQPSVEQGFVLPLHVGTRLRRLLKSYYSWVADGAFSRNGLKVLGLDLNCSESA
jgi:hypothetical protein